MSVLRPASGHLPDVLALGLGLGAALAFGLAAVLQQRAAGREPLQAGLSARLVLTLFHSRLWVTGIALMTCGYGLQVAALRAGGLVILEPLLALSIVFAVPLAAMWARHPMTWWEWVELVAAAGGVALFLLAGSPTDGRATASVVRWVPVLAGVGGAIAVAVVVGYGLDRTARALLLGAASGLLAGLSDALTKTTVALFDRHSVMALAAWPPYAMAAAGIAAFVLAQNAYNAAPLPASYPVLNVAEPLLGAVLGMVLFGEHLRLGGLAPVWAALGVVAAVTGVAFLARSPLVTAEVHRTDAARSGEVGGRNDRSDRGPTAA